MALIRGIRKHENSWMYAYVEWSDENPNHFIILGGKEFSKKEDAENWSKGFALESYEYKEPIELKRDRLLKEKDRLSKLLSGIEEELKTL